MRRGPCFFRKTSKLRSQSDRRLNRARINHGQRAHLDRRVLHPLRDRHDRDVRRRHRGAEQSRQGEQVEQDGDDADINLREANQELRFSQFGQDCGFDKIREDECRKLRNLCSSYHFPKSSTK